ncbi:MAG: hypothetical protein PHE43_02595 [Candidatus Nanoarchaeia archaeon]|nr:hypothetical protein [Candidatus Nanoarchaeia archaeon]
MKNKKVIITIVVLVLILALLGYSLYSIMLSKYKFKYEGFNIEKIADQGYEGYRTEIYINGAEEPFYINSRYAPGDVEDIPFEQGLKQKINGKNPIYVTIDPTQQLTGKTTIAALNINNMIEQVFRVEVKSALTQDVRNNMTIKNCENKEDAVIWLKLGDSNRIYSQDLCIIIEGRTQDDLVKGADLFDFVLLDIIK